MKDQKYQEYLTMDGGQNDMLVAVIEMMEERFDAKFTYNPYWVPHYDHNYVGCVTVSRGFTLTFKTRPSDAGTRHWAEDTNLKVERCRGRPERRIAHHTKNLRDITTWTRRIVGKIVADVPEAGTYLRMAMQIRFGAIPDFLERAQ